MNRYVILILSALSMVGCSYPRPFIDSYSGVNNQEVYRSSADRVVVCYNERVWGMDTLQALADAECARTKRRAVYDTTTPWSCSLTAPSSAYFNCQ